MRLHVVFPFYFWHLRVYFWHFFLLLLVFLVFTCGFFRFYNWFFPFLLLVFSAFTFGSFCVYICFWCPYMCFFCSSVLFYIWFCAFTHGHVIGWETSTFSFWVRNAGRTRSFPKCVDVSKNAKQIVWFIKKRSAETESKTFFVANAVCGKNGVGLNRFWAQTPVLPPGWPRTILPPSPTNTIFAFKCVKPARKV